MRHILTILLLIALPAATHAQRLNPDDYIYPMRGVSGLCSANFGELRPGHFHSGIDIKTEGVEGKSLVATADGYISRLLVAPGGFGRALYLTLNNGTTAVYGHLQRFRTDLEEYVSATRHARQTNSLDQSFTPDRWPVKQGALIGYSGNSGGSMGPHLHFEVRDTPSQQPLNLVRERIICPKDTQPPHIVKIHYVEIDTVQNDGVCLRSAPQSYTVNRTADNSHTLAQREAVTVGRKGYFVVEVTDRRDGVNNRFGVWRITATIDRQPYFEYRMDHFSFDLSRCCDAVSCYPLQRTSRNETIRLAQLAGAPDCFYTLMTERGLIRTTEGQTRRLRIEAEDDSGNISAIEFDICGRAGDFRAQADADATLLRADSESVASIGGEATLRLPAGALYENGYFHPETTTITPTDSSIILLSPAYRFIASTTPLRYAASITIRAVVPQALQLRTVMATRSDKGSYSYIGGTYLNGAVTAQSRATGSLCLVADTLPPRIRPLFKAEANLTQSKALRFRVSDNFSGIASCALSIDQQWMPCDRYPMQGTLVHLFETPATRQTHRAQLIVTDNCGNSTRWEGTFYR
ncbi:MAG: M23 family metallopeptidase [Alistipes sp.]